MLGSGRKVEEPKKKEFEREGESSLAVVFIEIIISPMELLIQ